MVKASDVSMFQARFSRLDEIGINVIAVADALRQGHRLSFQRQGSHGGQVHVDSPFEFWRFLLWPQDLLRARETQKVIVYLRSGPQAQDEDEDRIFDARIEY